MLHDEPTASPLASIEPGVIDLARRELAATYDEMRWLAARPDVSIGMARAWYVGIRSTRLARRIRIFTGRVSAEAAAATPNDRIVREHFGRIHASISELLKRHVQLEITDADEFIELALRLEQVHLVTEAENQTLLAKRGDYERAGVRLIDWVSLNPERRRQLWTRCLKGKVANAAEFRPCAAAQPVS